MKFIIQKTYIQKQKIIMGFSDTIHDNLFKYDVDDDVVLTDEEKQKILYDVKHYKETGFYGEEFKWGEICEWIANSDISNLKKVGMILDYPIPFKKEWWSMDYWKVKCEIMNDYWKVKCQLTNKKYEEEIKELKEDNDKLRIAMIKNTQQNYAEWKKEIESDAIGLIRLDLERAEEENKKLQEEIKELKKQYHKEFVKGEYKTMVKEENKKIIQTDGVEVLYDAEMEKLQEEIKHKDEKFYEFCEENKKLREEIDKLQEYIDNFDDNYEEVKFGMYKKLDDLDLLEDEKSPEFINMWKKLEEQIDKLTFFNRDCKEETQRYMEENEKLIDEIECRNSTWETKEKEYEGELAELRLLVDKNTNVVEYLNTQLEKYKTTLQKLKTECDKVKGISVNKDNTKIKINDIELIVGDKFSLSNEVGIFELKEIYVGKSGKYSLRTDYKTIRLGNKFIIGSVKILKE